MILACSTFLGAGTFSQLNLQIENGAAAGTILVTLDGLEQQNTRLSIQDLSGKQWFSEFIRKQNHFSTIINLNALPSGVYLLRVNNKSKQQSRAFQFINQEVVVYEQSSEASTSGGLVLDAGGHSRLIARVSAAHAQMLRLHFSNIQEYQLDIQLIAPDGSVKWAEMVSHQAAFATNIDLKALMVEPGAYILTVRAGEASLIQELEMKPAGLQLGMTQHVSKTMTSPEVAKN